LRPPRAEPGAATTSATPRIACRAATTGAIDQLGSTSSIYPCQSLEPRFRILDGVNVILQHDLLRRMASAFISLGGASTTVFTPIALTMRARA
jgi:hypothetical protein